MKSTDYAPRAAAMDVYLMGKTNLIGAEIGVDAGAHAEAMLTYLNIEKLYLIDLWEREWVQGFCEGRLSRWKTKTTLIQASSHNASSISIYGVLVNPFDFVYIDIAHDYETVKQSLNEWWYKLKDDGILGYRNYTTCQKAIDEFVQANNIRFEIDKYHNEIILFK